MKLFLLCGTALLMLLVGGTIIRHRAAARKFNKKQPQYFVGTLLLEIVCDDVQSTSNRIQVADFSKYDEYGIVGLQLFFFKKNYDTWLREHGLEAIEGETRTLLMIQNVYMQQYCMPNGKTIVWKWGPLVYEDSEKN